MKDKARNFLSRALNSPNADFRQGQWESIEALLARKRIFVVQRTGWGKSMVYFLATKLLREQGYGPTLLISPLLSLMRDQLKAAERIGVKAETINCENQEDWERIQHFVNKGEVDVLLISPERLSNDNFRQEVLSSIAQTIGLFVVDEAHCISDWGHDFRPDYRRIVRVLQAMPPNVPVMATTATANDRVIEDVKQQIGSETVLLRGPLERKSLRLCKIPIGDDAEKMAWLAANVPFLPGSGIIYTLKISVAEMVASWLRQNNIEAEAYHGNKKPETREELEQRLLKNEVKALVATVALGMGFDKPDLRFVVHYNRPPSVIHYYQQVGRAGRAVDEAYGILFSGTDTEGDKTVDYFISSAFPSQDDIETVLAFLQDAERDYSIKEMEQELNLKEKEIKKVLKILSVESPAPVIETGSKWSATLAAESYVVDEDHVNAITAIRRAEQNEMTHYKDHTGCLMEFLQKSLDDQSPCLCGRCSNCSPDSFQFIRYDEETEKRATRFLRNQKQYRPIYPRTKLPVGQSQSLFGFSDDIPKKLRFSEGRVLCRWSAPGWRELVSEGKYKTGRFSDELVNACWEMVRIWKPQPEPRWITCVPSLNHPELVPDFTERLAKALGIRFVPCIEKVRSNRPQKEMENDFQQVNNLDGVFKFTKAIKPYSPCLLVDDMVDSRWTFTVISAILRESGVKAVYPLALASTASKDR